jgi:hypothetical protein
MEHKSKTKSKKVIDHVTTTVNIRKSELNKNGYKDLNDWLKDEDHVYIGRNMSFYVPGADGSIWQNPFKVAKNDKKTNKNKYTLDESLNKYREYIENNEQLKNRLCELKGKTLGCWCKPNKCHGDILCELINKYCEK